MAEKEQQSAYPAYIRHTDAEAVAVDDVAEQRKMKRNKLILYIVLFVIFQIAVITAFSLTVMKVKTPKFRLREATITTINTGAGLQATVAPQFSIKNTNFGRYKYRNTTVDFFYGNAMIGQAQVPNSKAGWLSSKKIQVPAVELSISSTPELSSQLSSGTVTISSSARMTGKVELMFIMKKSKATNLNCTMDIVIATSTLTNIRCK